MRITISSEQKKFFLSKGYIEFDTLISQEDTLHLSKEIEKVRQKSPGHPENNLFRSIPFLLKLFRKRQIGEIAYSLLEKKPIRIEHDQFFRSFPREIDLQEEQPLALLLFLQNGNKGIFFRDHLPKLYKDVGSCYLIVFTTQPLLNDLNPILYP